MIGFSGQDVARSLEARAADTAFAGAGVRAAPAAAQPLSALAEKIAAEPVAPGYSASVIAGVTRLIEFTSVIGLGAAVYALTVMPATGFSFADLLILSAVAGLAAFGFQASSLYSLAVLKSRLAQIGRMAAIWTVLFAVMSSVMALGPGLGGVHGVWLMVWYGAGLAMLVAGRLIISQVVRQWSRAGRLQRRAVIVGGGEPAEALVRAVAADPDSDVTIAGFFDDRTDDRTPTHVGHVPKLGTVDDLVVFSRKARVDLVIVTIPMSAESRVLTMLGKLWVLPVDIRLAAHKTKLQFRPRAYSYIGKVPVIDVFDKPIQDWDIVMKWAFDKAVGTCALIALSPVFLATAIAIKLDSRGPVFFRQKRYGFNNELIEVFKFRSMYVDQADAKAAKLVTKGDPRVTRVGRFIRKTSIDELPQLLNVVFRGDLSLVGPRPHAVHAKAADRLYDDVVDGYFARHKVKPGITGWAQINGWRGETDTAEKIQKRVEHDIHYIENWSILADIKILALTPWSLARHRENAY